MKYSFDPLSYFKDILLFCSLLFINSKSQTITG